MQARAEDRTTQSTNHKTEEKDSKLYNQVTSIGAIWTKTMWCQAARKVVFVWIIKAKVSPSTNTVTVIWSNLTTLHSYSNNERTTIFRWATAWTTFRHFKIQAHQGKVRSEEGVLRHRFRIKDKCRCALRTIHRQEWLRTLIVWMFNISVRIS